MLTGNNSTGKGSCSSSGSLPPTTSDNSVRQPLKSRVWRLAPSSTRLVMVVLGGLKHHTCKPRVTHQSSQNWTYWK